MTRLTKRNLLAIASSVFLACVSAGSSVSGGEALTVTSVTWSVQEGASGGTVSSAGLYTASATTGTYHVVATSQADPTKSASATVAVTTGTSPPPGGAHPRLFMTAANISAFSTQAGAAGTSSKALVGQCQDALDHPASYSSKAGNPGSDVLWWGITNACAFSYRATGNAAHRDLAIYYWQHALDDYQTIGDGQGCTTSAMIYDWKHLWSGGDPEPQMFNQITPDTGYPMRWVGNFVLAYDWLHDALGVTEALRNQTRVCVTAWLDNYSLRGYNRTQVGSNYHAGFFNAKTIAARAFAGEAADDHLWTETVNDLFATQFVGTGLATSPTYGNLVGGDFDTWQYGPLAVANYALAVRAIEEAGVPQPAADSWLAAMALRNLHAQTPVIGTDAWGNGDAEPATIHHTTNASQLDAVILGADASSAGWVAKLKRDLGLTGGNFWNALAEIRAVTPQDYRSISAPLWYVARGTGTVYARTSWSPSALWAVFMSRTNKGEADHAHSAASNFVFSRGADHLVIDPSNYGEMNATQETNAVSVISAANTAPYRGGQTPWGHARLPWARATTTGVYAARADFAQMFDDIPYAHREWVFLPEGEIVTIDRVRNPSAATDGTLGTVISFHANTGGGGLAFSGGAYLGTVGTSKIAIHPVMLTGNPTPIVYQPAITSTAYYCGTCTSARYANDAYTVTLRGAWTTAIHAIDGYASTGSPATVQSLSADSYNAGVIGASVLQTGQQSYVVASSAQDGVAGSSMTYRVLASSTSRHVVFDAPEDANGKSSVSAVASGGSCTVTITAGAGVTGRPLMFSVGPAPGCAVSELAAAPPAAGP